MSTINKEASREVIRERVIKDYLENHFTMYRLSKIYGHGQSTIKRWLLPYLEDEKELSLPDRKTRRMKMKLFFYILVFNKELGFMKLHCNCKILLIVFSVLASACSSTHSGFILLSVFHHDGRVFLFIIVGIVDTFHKDFAVVNAVGKCSTK